jgi:Putative 2OG-Fe(II) oxygenase
LEGFLASLSVGSTAPSSPAGLPGRRPGAAGTAAMEEGGDMLALFPHHVLQGQLPEELLRRLQAMAAAMVADPAAHGDASSKLAGQLALQLEIGPSQPAAADLCHQVILPACDRWLRHVMDQQPEAARGPWRSGAYQLQMYDLWLNVQRAGDYNPTHTHGASFSGVIYLQVPPQIHADSADGQLCLHGPEAYHLQSFRLGMAHYVLPIPGRYLVFPAWQPHSVLPFRGEGERWSLAFNVLAVPQQAASNLAPAPDTGGNVSLSSRRPKPGGFL